MRWILEARNVEDENEVAGGVVAADWREVAGPRPSADENAIALPGNARRYSVASARETFRATRSVAELGQIEASSGALRIDSGADARSCSTKPIRLK
jgi:hypothetical protein